MVNTHPHKLSDAARMSRAHKAVNQVPLSITASLPQYADRSVSSYCQDFLAQAKRLSQLLAYSWMSDGQAEEMKQQHERFPITVTEPPSTIAHTLQYGTSEDIKEMFNSQADVDLSASLGPEVKISIDWNTFDGSIESGSAAAVPTENREWWYTFNVPYPPRPASVETWQLEEWVLDQGENYAPCHPYIPLCSGS